MNDLTWLSDSILESLSFNAQAEQDLADDHEVDVAQVREALALLARDGRVRMIWDEAWGEFAWERFEKEK